MASDRTLINQVTLLLIYNLTKVYNSVSYIQLTGDELTLSHARFRLTASPLSLCHFYEFFKLSPMQIHYRLFTVFLPFRHDLQHSVNSNALSQ